MNEKVSAFRSILNMLKTKRQRKIAAFVVCLLIAIAVVVLKDCKIHTKWFSIDTDTKIPKMEERQPGGAK